MKLVNALDCPCLYCAHRSDYCSRCERFIRWLDTPAYNIDAVVEQLEEMKAKPMELVYDVPLINGIIDIVRKGGTE